MAVPDNVQEEGLVRVIGTGALGLCVVNMVVGAGIFALPGHVAAGLGSAAIIAYVICSVTVALVFLCFAEVGSRISRSGDMLGGPRILFASALDGNVPKFLGKVHPKYKTPHVAIIFTAIVIGAFAVSGTFESLAVVATGSLLLVDLGVIFVLLRLRQRDGLPKEGQFKLPFGPVIPLLSCAIVGWLLLQMPLDEAKAIAAMVGVCVAFYAIRSFYRRRENN